MSASTIDPPHISGSAAPLGEKIFRCGTLAYTKEQLYVLFFWLCWNDFTVTLLQDPSSFGGFLQKDYGATNEQIAWFGVVGTIMNCVINPAFSVWSDRTRTSWGRRRPFLLVATPPLALFTMAMPYMPNLVHYMEKHNIATSLLHALPTNGTVFMLGLCTLGITFFNSIVGTLFSYLYWDVVPQEILGRWTSMRELSRRSVSSSGSSSFSAWPIIT